MNIFPKIGVTAGSFDLIHPGHIIMLQDCKKVCDYLVVLLQSDPSIDRISKNKPIQTIEERKIMLESIKYVDKVIIYNTENDLRHWLTDNEQKISVRIIGSDHEGKNITAGELNIPIYYHNRNHDWSSTNMRYRVWLNENNKKRLLGILDI